MGAQEYSPILALAQKLKKGGIPSLGALVARIGDTEGFAEFVAIIREFLPEHEAEILQEADIPGQVAVFCQHFEPRYFPMGSGGTEYDWVETYGDFCSWVDYPIEGFSWEDYDALSSDQFRPGLQLMSYLLDLSFVAIEGEDRSVALAAACVHHVPRELLERVPEKGFPEEVINLLSDGPHEGVLHWANYLFHNTGTQFLDLDVEEAGYYQVEWCREEIDRLTQEWQRAEVIRESAYKESEWLELDMPAHFAELIDFIERRILESGNTKTRAGGR